MIIFSEHLSNNYKHQNEYLRYTTKNKFAKLVEVLGVDIIDIINDKMDKTEKKYPIDKSKGVSTKYDKL